MFIPVYNHSIIVILSLWRRLWQHWIWTATLIKHLSTWIQFQSCLLPPKSVRWFSSFHGWWVLPGHWPILQIHTAGSTDWGRLFASWTWDPWLKGYNTERQRHAATSPHLAIIYTPKFPQPPHSMYPYLSILPPHINTALSLCTGALSACIQ